MTVKMPSNYAVVTVFSRCNLVTVCSTSESLSRVVTELLESGQDFKIVHTNTYPLEAARKC